MVRTVQSLRKEADFIITDHINIYYYGSSRIKEMIEKYSDYIQNETLADSINFDENLDKEYTLNDEKVSIKVERI